MTGENLDSAKQQWAIAADSIPQLICLLDSEGRIVLANRTVERWGLGTAGAAHGRTLHQLLHKDCDDPACYLIKFERQAIDAFPLSRRARCDSFDPALGRHFEIRIQPPVHSAEEAGDLFAIVTVDDISELKFYEKKMQVLRYMHQERIAGEVAKRIEAEEIRNRMVSILERTPNLIAMADADGALLYLNPAGRAMMEVGEHDDLAGLSLLGSHTPAAREILVREALPAAQHCGVWSGDSTLLSSNGAEIPTTQILIANHGPKGQMDGYSFVEQNMTAWVTAENALRHSQEELQQLSDQLLTIQETERQRIAADLHDGLGQSLTLIKLSLDEVARQVARGAGEEAAESIQRLIPKVKDTLTEVRRISMDLRPSTLDDLGILATLSWFFRDFEEHCRSIAVEKDFSVIEGEIPAPIKTSMFRILQEAINNIVKHAGASLVQVSLKREDQLLRMTISDNGKGFDTTLRKGRPTAQGGGLGLLGMKERARLTGGTLMVDSTPAGTQINIWWPAGEVQDPFGP